MPFAAANISPDGEGLEGIGMKLLHHSYSTNGVRPSSHFENGMIRLARHLLRMSKKFRCGGYDIGIDVDSDDDQVYGHSDAHLW